MANKPIQFFLREQKLNIGKQAGKTVIVARPTGRHRVDFRNFCERIAKSTTFNAQEVAAVLNLASETARDIVANGDIVEFGDLGTMSPSFVGKVVTKVEDFNVLTHITRPKVCFRPSRDFFDLRTYPGVSFQRIDAPTPQSKGKKKPAPKTPKSKEGGSGDS